jgi:4-hydroxy-4-methyl-2-oxoglutarate aldolase
MITDPPLLKIRRGFERPSADLLARFAGVPTGNLADAMGGRGCLDHRIKPLLPAPLCGTAVTSGNGPADNLALFASLDVAWRGDVLVAATDAFHAAAIAGDLLLGMSRNCGVAGLVTDGLVRDIVGVLAVGVQVYCAGVTANSAVRNGPGTVGLPVVLGGVVVASGDIVVGDRDGVVIVPLAAAADVLARLAHVRGAEATREAQVRAGLLMPDNVRALLASERVTELSRTVRHGGRRPRHVGFRRVPQCFRNFG